MSAQAADIVGAWIIHGSVFFNAVDTTCLFKTEGTGITATCENDGKPGDFTPATVDGSKVAWSWNSGPAVLAFAGAFTSDTVIKGEITVRGFTGSSRQRSNLLRQNSAYGFALYFFTAIGIAAAANSSLTRSSGRKSLLYNPGT